MKYVVKALFSCTQYGRVWIEVEAKDEDEALEKAGNHDHVGIEYKSDDEDDYEFDFDGAEIWEA